MPWIRETYPANWPDLRAAVQRRAGDRCETCGVPNRALIIREPASARYRILRDLGDAEAAIADGDRVTEVICTTAHIYDDDHATQDIVRLVFECQRCHLGRDMDKHVANAAATRRRKREQAGQLALMEVPRGN